MKRDLAGLLGPLEAEVLEQLWANDAPLTVREVLGGLNDGRVPPLAYTTVMTVMSRLADKGILVRRQQGRGYQYQAAVRDAATRRTRSTSFSAGASALRMPSAT